MFKKEAIKCVFQTTKTLSWFSSVWTRSEKDITHHLLAVCGDRHGELMDHQRYNQPALCSSALALIYALISLLAERSLLKVTVRTASTATRIQFLLCGCLDGCCVLVSSLRSALSALSVCDYVRIVCARLVWLLVDGALPPISTQSWNIPGRIVTDTHTNTELMKNKHSHPLS